MNGYWILGIWTGLGLTWWILSFLLVVAARPRRSDANPVDRRRITIFKPLAPLASEEFERIVESPGS